MKYYLIAGEASGDLHASNLMKALKLKDSQAEFRFLGGDLMKSVGGVLVKHYKEMAFMGIVPVLLHLRTILRNMRMCQKDIASFNPDVVILIDYPGFNLKIAKYVKENLKCPVYYYISPKIWAWKEYRIKSFRKYVDKMFCILPFEVDYFKGLDYYVDYVGNPTLDAVCAFEEDKSLHHLVCEKKLEEKPILAILCGSRKQEIKDNLPTMLRVAARYPELQPVIAGAPGIAKDFYQQYIEDTDVVIVFEKTYALLKKSSYALVTSGTATLETSLFRVPQIVCYKTPVKHLIRFIFDHFFHVDYISLVNLIANEKVVEELFADRFSEEEIVQELDRLINDLTYKKKMLKGYDKVRDLLGDRGASMNTASLIFNYLQSI